MMRVMKNAKEPTAESVLHRLNRAEGQIRALKRTLEQEDSENCRDFIIQVKAARAALKRASEQYVLLHMHQCQSLPTQERNEKMTDAINLLASD